MRSNIKSLWPLQCSAYTYITAGETHGMMSTQLDDDRHEHEQQVMSLKINK